MPQNSNRDDFTTSTKLRLERQAGNRCSNPGCRQLTSGAMSDVSDVIKIGVAAHICAAAPGGPRYDGDMTIGQRRSAENGIWLCEKCARFVDSKDPKFTVELLKDWKYQRASETFRSVTERAPFETAAKNPTTDELRDRLCAAAKADLGVFRNTTKWPDTTIALTLKVEGVDEALSTRALAEIVTAFDDLILVAAPGMGKTTTVFQVAEGLLETGCGTPLIVMLGEWATDSDDLLQSILKRSRNNLFVDRFWDRFLEPTWSHLHTPNFP